MRPIRQFVVFGFLVLFAGILGGRLYYWQVLQHDKLAAMAQNEHLTDETIPATRGEIFDTFGNVLATNEAVDSVYASRKQIDDPQHVAAVLSPLIDVPADTILGRITDQNVEFVRLKPWVTPEVSQRIKDAKLGGIFLEPTTHRIYPQGTLGSQLLGFSNADGQGQYGLEEFYDKQLAGTPGHLRAETDTAGRPINFVTPRDSLPAQDGASLVTSIDSTLQYIAQTELAAAVKQHKATGGSIIIMDPFTGALLADANVPDFDPAQYASSDASTFPNPSISKIYEPGSTFKIITMSTGLAEHQVQPDTPIHDPGFLSLGGITITNWDGKGHSPETATMVLQYSSNVGAATIGWKVGADKYYPHIKDFGFGQKTGIDLAGELAGQVLFPDQNGWTPSNLVTNSFGQGIAVTPMQLVTAVASVANGGMLVQPHVVRQIKEANATHDVNPAPIRRVLEPDVAKTMAQMLTDSAAAKGSEAFAAVVPGYKVAVKTGTAQIASPTGGYESDKFVASLMGFAPADDPKFVMLVKIDQPQDVPFGSEVAAPVWKSIAQQLFVHFKVEPSDPEALAKSAATPTAVVASAPTAAASTRSSNPSASPRPGQGGGAGTAARPSPTARAGAR
ncbi:MAG: penicillin-binding protein 2 [Chloroflexi bacterium]|nr:penicillin-binding protein 2 [Chloroflexota bacterium]